MDDWSATDMDHEIEAAMTRLEDERRKLARLGTLWDEERTTVRSKDQSLSFTFDGRGEPIELVFNESKYRMLAPKQLASILLETLRTGRERSLAKVAEAMGTDADPGFDLRAAVTGKMDPRDILDSLLEPMRQLADDLDGPGLPALGSRRDKEG